MSVRRIGFLSALATMMVVMSMGWSTTIAAPPAKAGKTIVVTMTGAAERPGPGDENGTGKATFVLNPGQGTICYTLEAANIDAATAAHIHRAPSTLPGPVVVPLAAPTPTSSGCVNNVARELIVDILANPDQYYVNVHNAAFPGGAIRGQLG
jgi:hypothetical protein